MTKEELENSDGISQDVLKYAYEEVPKIMACHPDITKKYKEFIQKQPFFTSKDEAMKSAAELEKLGSVSLQIWAEVGKDEDFYYIKNHFIVSDDAWVKIAAEYVGMALIYS